MSEPQLSIRVKFAKPPQGSGDPGAMMREMSEPNERMRQALTLGMQKLAFRAQKERFTGKGPFPVAERRLGNVTGRLKRDLHAEDVTLTATGYQGRIGAAVEYFGAHEVGFTGIVDVPAHTRQAREVNRRAQTRTSKKGKAFSVRANQFSLLPQSVRAHKRNMKVPARAPLRTALEQHSEKILGAEIQKTVKAAGQTLT